jgi:hypothetical protein
MPDVYEQLLNLEFVNKLKSDHEGFVKSRAKS